MHIRRARLAEGEAPPESGQMAPQVSRSDDEDWGAWTLGRRAWLAAAAGNALPSLAGASTTVRWLHIEQNSVVAGFYAEAARAFEAATPGVKVHPQFLENESFKRKLTTLMQSRERPHLIYSWGGGALREQVRAGVVEDLTAQLDQGDWRQQYSPSVLQPYTMNGRLFGVPMLTSLVGFFYSKPLFAKAGVDAEAIRTWDDLLAAVRRLQAAGITPLVAGGADKWTLMFYWAYLALRLGGRAALELAMQGGTVDGFAGPAYVRAGELFRQLTDLRPFQSGFLAASYPQSAGQFGDGKGAMILMLDQLRTAMQSNSANKVGLAEADLGWFPFPAVPGGKGHPDETMGGMNGWLVTKGAPREAIAFLRFFLGPTWQRRAGERGWFIPVTREARAALTQPLLKRMAEAVGRSPYHQLFLDQMLGPSVGAVLNDVAADLASQRLSPREAAARVQEAWRLTL